MHIRDHTSDVSRRVRLCSILTFIHECPGRFIPMRVIPFICRVNRFRFVRDTNVLMRQHKSSNRWIQRESMDALSPGQDQLRGTTVHAVSSCCEFVSWLQNIRYSRQESIEMKRDKKPSTYVPVQSCFFS